MDQTFPALNGGSIESTPTVPKGLTTKFKTTFLFKQRRAQFTMVPLSAQKLRFSLCKATFYSRNKEDNLEN